MECLSFVQICLQDLLQLDHAMPLYITNVCVNEAV